MIRLSKENSGTRSYLLNASYFDTNIYGINMLMGRKWQVSTDYKIRHCSEVVICFNKGATTRNDFYTIFKLLASYV